LFPSRKEARSWELGIRGEGKKEKNLTPNLSKGEWH